MQDLNAIEMEGGVDVGGATGPDAGPMGGNDAKGATAVANGDEEGAEVEGEEVTVADFDGEIHGDVDGDWCLGGYSYVVEAETDQL